MDLSPRIRSLASAGLLALGLALFVAAVHTYYPLQHWLFFRYLSYWLSCALMASSCLALGHRLARWLGGSAVRFGEHLLLAFACGVFVFGLGVFFAGLLGLYGPLFFFAWPLLMLLASGKRSTLGLLRGIRRVFVGLGPAHGWLLPRSLQEWLRLAFLGFGLLAVYTQVITPENVSFDSRWYHLGIADQYAAQGAIRRFPEGWYLAAYPQLAVWLYTWAFQMPGTLFDHVALAAHVEWTLFLATLPGIALLVRRVAGGLRVRWASAALFLFPSVLLYDSNLNSGADHVLAFWAIPLALSLCVLQRALTTRSVLLLALIASGALLTKYQAIYLIVPAAILVVVLLVRSRRLGLLVPGTLAVLVLTAPHWLKNVLYYGDPLYPMLHKHLAVHPFHPGARAAMDAGFLPSHFMLNGPLLYKLRETAKTLATFAFLPHNWKGFAIPEPTFGSLFSLLVPLLPFLSDFRSHARGRASTPRRLWLLVGSTYLGVAIWFWTNHQDRYLQALLPWMVVTVVAVTAQVWTFGIAARTGLVALMAFQIIWGSDIYFYPTHRMIRDVPIKSLADFLSAGHRSDYEGRFVHWGDTSRVAAELPSDAVALVHDKFLRLGLSRAAVTDEWGFQGALSYRELTSTRAVWQAWKDLGVSHVIWAPSKIGRPDQATLARQAIFYEAALRASQSVREVQGLQVAELATEAPLERRRVLRVAGCGRDPASGTFVVVPAGRRGGGPSLRPVSTQQEDDVTVVAARFSCGLSDALRTDLTQHYGQVADLGGLTIWVRK